MEKNIYTEMGIQSREDCISNMLRYAFQYSEIFRKEFVKHVCEDEIIRYDWAEAQTRIHLGNSGIPDLVIVLKSNKRAKIVVIENKIKAEEGIDQTKRYSSENSKDILRKRFLNGQTDVEFSFIFLTLFPDQRPEDSSGNWRLMCHRDIMEFARPISDWDDFLAERLVSDW